MHRHAILYHVLIHIPMPTSPNGMLLIGTWVPSQPIGISISPTKPVNYIKVIFLQDKCPPNQLSYEFI